MATKIDIFQDVVQQIKENIASFEPERGGALLGPIGRDVISRFIYDNWAMTTGGSYVPSDELIQIVPKVEVEENLELKGIIHSHPTGFDRPSGQDIYGPFTKALTCNAHLLYFLGPIVNIRVRGQGLKSHEIPCGNGKISFYIAERDNGSFIKVNPIKIQVIDGNNETKNGSIPKPSLGVKPMLNVNVSIRDQGLKLHEIPSENGKRSFIIAERDDDSSITVNAIEVQITGVSNETEKQKTPKPSPAVEHFMIDISNIIREFNLSTDLSTTSLSFGDVDGYGTNISMSDSVDLMLLFSESYPFIPPIATITINSQNGDKKSRQIILNWNLDIPSPERLLTALKEYFISDDPRKIAYGPEEAKLVTEDPAIAKVTGWRSFYVNSDRKVHQFNNELFQRSKGILTESIFQKHILIAGLGSVGSYMSELFVRSGVGRLTLIDPEVVDGVNLSRSIYTIEDVGKKKTDALAKRLLNINPSLVIDQFAEDLTNLDPKRIKEMVLHADMVVAATDDIQAQRVLNRFAYACKKPSLYVGIWAGARGGEVIYVLPEITACYLCATKTRVDDQSPEVDYATGRLVGEVALAADIQHITSSAVRIGLSMLAVGDSEDTGLGEFIRVPARENRNFVAFGNQPSFWAFPVLMENAMGQYAYQSAWIRIPRSDDCDVCGNERQDPLAIPIKSPRADEIRSIISRSKTEKNIETSTTKETLEQEYSLAQSESKDGIKLPPSENKLGLESTVVQVSSEGSAISSYADEQPESERVGAQPEGENGVAFPSYKKSLGLAKFVTRVVHRIIEWIGSTK